MFIDELAKLFDVDLEEMKNQPPSTLGAVLARTAPVFKNEALALYKLLLAEMVSNRCDVGHFGELCVKHTLQPHLVHNSDNNSRFYNELFSSVLSNLQEPSFNNIKFSSALAYTSLVEFAGFAPVFASAVGTGEVRLLDVEPVFNVWCQDEDIVPDKTLAFRFSVQRDFSISFTAIDMSFLGNIPNQELKRILVRESNLDSGLKMGDNKKTKVTAKSVNRRKKA